MFDYDAELRRFHERLREAAAVETTDRVLDIGCGTGLTTREAATQATRGSALGVDVSRPMLDRARELTEQSGLTNVEFQFADAQVHPFAPGGFTLAISRFGTMFFADPAAAFANIGRALQPGGRFVQLVWQAVDRQEWIGAVREALTGDRSPPSGLTAAAFSLAEPSEVEGLLTDAGYTAVELTDVHEPVYYGPDAAGARAALLDLGLVQDPIADLDEAATARALERLLALLDAHDTGDGVWFDARAWLVSARRA